MKSDNTVADSFELWSIQVANVTVVPSSSAGMSSKKDVFVFAFVLPEGLSESPPPPQPAVAIQAIASIMMPTFLIFFNFQHSLLLVDNTNNISNLI